MIDTMAQFIIFYLLSLMRPQILPPITLSVVVAAGGRTRRRTGVPGKPCPTAGKTSQQKLPILPPPV